jgi:hypothetical protein
MLKTVFVFRHDVVVVLGESDGEDRDVDPCSASLSLLVANKAASEVRVFFR